MVLVNLKHYWPHLIYLFFEFTFQIRNTFTEQNSKGTKEHKKKVSLLPLPLIPHFPYLEVTISTSFLCVHPEMIWSTFNIWHFQKSLVFYI